MADLPPLIALVVNAALLVTMALVLDVVVRGRSAKAPLLERVAAGVGLGALGVLVMLLPFTLEPGASLDVRTVLLGLSGLFFGAVPTLIAMIVTAGLRVALGGLGMAVGVAMIVSSGAIGLAWRHWRRARLQSLGWLELYAFGLVVHATVAVLLLGMPWPVGGLSWFEATWPMLLVYPLLTVGLGLLLVARHARARTVAALAESEARFRGLFERGHAIMLVVDPDDGRIVDANPAAVDYYGWSHAELTSMRIEQVNTLTRAEVTAAMQRARAGGGRSFSFEHRRADGSVRDVEVYSGPIERDGRTLLYSLIIDVHDRRLAEESQAKQVEEEARRQGEELDRQRWARLAALNLAEDALVAKRELERALVKLRTSEGRLRLLIEHAPAALAMFDRDLRFIAVSRRWLSDYGHEGQEVLGRHHFEVFAEIPQRWREVHQRALAGEALSSDEDSFVRPDGSVMWQRWAVRPWFEDEGGVGGIVIFTENITEVVRAREELLKLSRAVQQSPESIIITDVEGRIEYVNDAFVDSTGYVREEVLGQNPRILNSGRTPPETYDEMWTKLLSGQSWTGEFVNRRRDGSEYVELATLSPLTRPDGVITHYVAVKEDVTDKKRAAEELERYRHHLEELVTERTRQFEEATARAEAANQAKSAFLANMSHEIRTPMNAVVGLTHLLLRDDPTPAQRDRLGKIEGSVDHLLSIINDVLDLAKIEAGKLVVEERDFHLDAVLGHVSSMVNESARAKGLSVEVHDDHVPVWLRGDPARLRQALLNLAGNAVKFTERGSVTLRAELLREEEASLTVRFEVQDTGIGIPEERLPQLFQAFEQGDASISRDHGGTGLGLAITRRLTELMGGEVGAWSESGVGTRVWLEVPLRRGRGVMPRAPAKRAVEPEGEPLEARVLLVEDHPVNREVALDLLQALVTSVDGAENGRVAVEMADEQRYDLVFMDLHMPEMDGIEATRRLRELQGYADVPILALTASVLEEDRQACLSAGMNDFVAKPVDPAALQAKLSAWLRPRGPGDGEPAIAQASVAEAPSSPPAPLSTTLGNVGALDAADGVRRAGGDETKYLVLLRRFVGDHTEDVSALRDEIARADGPAARRRLHALKGAAATLGAVRVQRASEVLEAAFGGGRPTPELLSALEAELKELQRHVLALPGPPPATAPAPLTAAREVIERLQPLVTSNDTDALHLFEMHADVLNACCSQEAGSLRRQLQRYDFAAAAETLQHMKSLAGAVGDAERSGPS